MKNNQQVYEDMNASTERSLSRGTIFCYACNRTFVLFKAIKGIVIYCF